MAYKYKPNKYVPYDENLTFEENVQRDAVFTKEKIDRLEEAVKINSADLAIGELTFVKNEADAKVEIEFNELEGTRRINFALPTSSSSTGGDGKTPIKGIDYFTDEDKAELIDDIMNKRPDVPYYDADTKSFYACGNSIVVNGTDSSLNIEWLDGIEKKSANIPANANIYGGSVSTKYELNYPCSSIYINSGTINTIFGGGKGYSKVSDSIIVVNGGKIVSIYAGGANTTGGDTPATNSVGESTIIVNGAESIESIYGGGLGSVSVNIVDITVNGGKIGSLTAGGATGVVSSATVNIYGGRCDLVQGVRAGSVYTEKLLIEDGDVDVLYAGASSSSYGGNVYNMAIKLLGGNISSLRLGSGINKESVNGTYIRGVLKSDNDASSLELKETCSLSQIMTLISNLDISADIDDDGVLSFSLNNK